jgi:exodeoxyribonuclease VII large subunit
MILATRIDLVVPYVEKDDAKALGAQLDWDRKVWFAPPGIDLSPLQRWLPRGFAPPEPAQPDEATEPEKGMALIDLLAQIRVAVEGALPDVAWVRAEISELRGKNGHLYPTLTQRNERGDILAQAKGVIWRIRAETITTNDGVEGLPRQSELVHVHGPRVTMVQQRIRCGRNADPWSRS